MEKTHHSNPEHIGSIIEQWFKRFEFVAKEDDDICELTEGKLYPVAGVDMEDRRLAVMADGGYWEFFKFDEVPDYFEIRIREA